MALPAVLRSRALRDRALLPLSESTWGRDEDGKLALEGDFGPPPESWGAEWPPFRPFGDLYYTYQLRSTSRSRRVLRFGPSRIRASTRIRPITTPIAVPALIRRWWPMIYFLVFKAPPEGVTHVFRPGEPFAQILVVPEEADFELVPMPEDEAAERSSSRNGSTRAGRRSRPTANGRPRPTPSSTAPIAAFLARRPNAPGALAEAIGVLRDAAGLSGV